MVKIANHRHLDDTDLLSYLDRGLWPGRALLIRRHLGDCWTCRARLQEFENDIHHFTQLIQSDTYPSPDRVSAARAHVTARMWLACEESKPQPALPVRIRWRTPLLAAAACAVALLALVPFLRSRPVPPARTLLLETALAERTALQPALRPGRPARAVLQTYRVSARQSLPPLPVRESSLEVWTDSDSHKFSSRWSGLNGHLKHALWRSEGQNSYRDTGAGTQAWLPPVAPELSLAGLAFASSLDTLEARFASWLERRTWSPVSLSAELQQFVSQDGATLAALPIPSAAGRNELRLVATRKSGGVIVSLELIIDAVSRRPRAQRLSWQREGRAFIVEISESRPPRFMDASFEPRPSVPLLPRPSLLAPSPLPLNAPASSKILQLHVRTLYLLHRLHACLGETIEVVRRPDSVLVRGVSSTPERKQQIQDALASLDAPALNVELESADEAIARLKPAEISPEPPSLPVEIGIRAAGREPPWCRLLTSKECASLTVHILTQSENMVAEAAQVRDLEALRTAVMREIPATFDTGMLLDAMILAHLQGLSDSSNELFRLIGASLPEESPSNHPNPLGPSPVVDLSSATRSVATAVRNASSGSSVDLLTPRIAAFHAALARADSHSRAQARSASPQLIR